MPFSAQEKLALLALKGVGPTVIARLEQMGIHSLAELATSDVSDILAHASAALGSTCWKNSPQARAAISAAVELGKRSSGLRRQGHGPSEAQRHDDGPH